MMNKERENIKLIIGIINNLKYLKEEDKFSLKAPYKRKLKKSLHETQFTKLISYYISKYPHTFSLYGLGIRYAPYRNITYNGKIIL